jgi:hypothetical protein
MKRYLIFACIIATFTACSSTGGIKIISPSAPESEAKKEIREAPVTKLQAVSETEMKEQRHATPSRAPEKTLPKTGAASAPDHSGDAAVPSISSGHALEALINVLEKKGTIQREELLREIRKLEENDRAK